MLNIIKEETMKPGKKYIYAYDDEPDHSMHDFGSDSDVAKNLIENRDVKVKELCENLEDTIIFVIADHGHIKVDHLYLNDYPEILSMLERTTSIEQRAVSFKVKEGFHEEFKIKFESLFGNYFEIYDKQDVINSKLFGDGVPNELFEDAIGDFIAVATSSNKCLVTDGDAVLFSQHAGYTDEEIYVPLIVINKTSKY